MINANLLVYTRSLTRDYRWIYCSNCLEQSDKEWILEDYKSFEMDKSSYLSKKHLIVRKFKKSVAIYCFLETETVDQYSRNIYALAGCVFAGLDYEIVNLLRKYVILFFYGDTNVFKSYVYNITDFDEDGIESIQFSIDDIVSRYKRDINVQLSLVNKLDAFFKQSEFNDLVIIDGEVIPVVLESETIQKTVYYNEEIEGILSSENFGPIPQETPKKTCNILKNVGIESIRSLVNARKTNGSSMKKKESLIDDRK